MAIAQTSNRSIANAMNVASLLTQRRLQDSNGVQNLRSNADAAGSGDGAQVKKEIGDTAASKPQAATAGVSALASFSISRSTVSLNQGGKEPGSAGGLAVARNADAAVADTARQTPLQSESPNGRAQALASGFNDANPADSAVRSQPIARNAASAQAVATYAEVDKLSLTNLLESSRKEIEAQQTQLAEQQQSWLQEWRATVANGAATAAQFAAKLF